MSRSNREVVDVYFAAINSENWDALAEMWHPDAVWQAIGARPRHGKEDVLAYYPRALALFPEHHDEPTRIIEDGDTVVVEIAFTGVTPDGKPVSFEAVDVFDIEDGLIVKFSSWFDMDLLRAQL